jgi:hypothetical protein
MSATVIACSAPAPESTALDVKALAAQTSPFQAKILKDGKVTPTEYESAILAQRACVQSAGGTVSEVSQTGNNELGFTYTVEAPTEAARSAAERKSEACIPKYISEIGKAWAYEQLLSPHQLDELRADVAQCLRSVGIDLRDDFTTKQLSDYLSSHTGAVEAVKPCMDKYPGFFAINPADAQSGRSGGNE